MKIFRKILVWSLLIIFVMTAFSGCGKSGQGNDKTNNSNEDVVTINIAYQYGLAYAPLIIAQEKELVEQMYKEATGKEVEVIWTQMSSGADINTGIASGSLDVGFMGIAPAITGVTGSVGYKIFTNLSGQEHGLMTNDNKYQSIDDLIGMDKQIALVNIGSIQHIILAKALDNAGYDPHALDSNIVGMKHPDGMVSLQTASIPFHLTSNPYLYKEQETDGLFEVAGISEVWSVDNSFIVGVAATELYEQEPELYQALCDAIGEAIHYINENPKEASEMTCEYNGNTPEEELVYMQKGKYSTETKGIFELAVFMGKAKFIDNTPSSYEDLVFENVKGD